MTTPNVATVVAGGIEVKLEGRVSTARLLEIAGYFHAYCDQEGFPIHDQLDAIQVRGAWEPEDVVSKRTETSHWTGYDYERQSWVYVTVRELPRSASTAANMLRDVVRNMTWHQGSVTVEAEMLRQLDKEINR